MENLKNNIELVNLTPHRISMIGVDGIETIIESSGVARCQMVKKVIGDINGFPVAENKYGDVTGLPEPSKGKAFIVSALVAQAVKGIRDDIFVVDDTVRNPDGQIIGCRGFARI